MKDDLLATMLSGMGHELNNSLQALELNLSVLRLRGRKASMETWEGLEPHVEALESNLDLLNRRMAFLLSLAERGSSSEPVVLSLERVVSELLTVVGPDEKPNGVEVRGAASPVEVEAHEGHLLQLLLRIFSEAEAASADGAGEAGEAAESQAITIEEASGRGVLKIPLASTAGSDADSRRELEALARKAGGRLSVEPDSDSLVLEFPSPSGS